MRWCATWVGAALIVIWLFEALFGRPGSRADGAATPPSPRRAGLVGRRIVFVFALAGLGVWGLTFTGPDPSALGWAAIPIFVAIGYATICLLGGPSRPPLAIGIAITLIGALLLGGVADVAAAQHSGRPAIANLTEPSPS